MTTTYSVAILLLTINSAQLSVCYVEHLLDVVSWETEKVVSFK